MAANIKKFYRSRQERIIFGVCGGLGNYFQVDPTLIRVAFLLLTFMGGIGVIIYVILAIITPLEASSDLQSDSAQMFARRVTDQTHDLADKIKANNSSGKNLLGLTLLIFGILLLAKYYFGFFVNWNIVSPLLIIILGIYLIIKHK